MKILVAVTPAMKSTAEHALRCDDFELAFCHSMQDAVRQLLAQRFELIVCTLQFDESRLCDLLQYVKSTPSLAFIPFAALTFRKEEEGILPTEAVNIALRCAKLYGATDAINLPERRKELGDEPAFEELRMRLRRMGSPGKS